jgi:hypothetical protein
MRKFLEKLFHLPSPKELGWSEHDGLAMRAFQPFTQEKTWEDWEEHVKKHHPVKYFLLRGVGGYISTRAYRLKQSWYQFTCRILPSRRFHVLKLSNIDPVESYSIGYLDPCDQMYLAVWACFIRYVEKCKPEDPATYLTAEELAAEPRIKAEYDETMRLYKWFTVGQVLEYEAVEELRREMSSFLSTGDAVGYNTAQNRWSSALRLFEEHKEERFLRVCKLRPLLWD